MDCNKILERNANKTLNPQYKELFKYLFLFFFFFVHKTIK